MQSLTSRDGANVCSPLLFINSVPGIKIKADKVSGA